MESFQHAADARAIEEATSLGIELQRGSAWANDLAENMWERELAAVGGCDVAVHRRGTQLV